MARRPRNRRNLPDRSGGHGPAAPPLSRDQRLRQIVNAKNNFYLGLAALALFRDRAAYQPLRGLGVALSGKYGFHFSAVADLLDHSEAGPNARTEFETALLRMVLKEPFEVVRAFAEDHSRMAALRSEPWYQVARMLRNCVSHDFRIAFERHDLARLPVEWNGLRITADMDGEYLSAARCGPAFVKELVNAFEAFVRTTGPGAAASPGDS